MSSLALSGSSALTATSSALTLTEQRQSAQIVRHAQENLRTEIRDGDTLLIDFFAGTGGASMGFVLAGFKPVLIVEGEEKKRKQYEDNFKTKYGYDVFKRQENRENEKPYLVYERTKEKDAGIILNFLEEKVGDKKVRYHVHASPSCVEFCNTNRIRKVGKDRKKTKSNELSDSEGTFKWTCFVLKKMKEKFGDKMTWSIEDAAVLAGEENEKFDFPDFRKQLPAHTVNVWDFTLFGVPQDRKRAIVLDKALNISKLPTIEKPNMDEVKGEYWGKGLVDKVYSNEVRSDEGRAKRKYGGGVTMQGRIGMREAFELANKLSELPDNVQYMRSQSTAAQVGTLLREQNYERKAWFNLIKALKKPTTTLEAYLKEARNKKPKLLATRILKETVIDFVRKNKEEGKVRVIEMAQKKYARIYEELTILAKLDLVMFIQSCDEEKRENILNIPEVKEYVKRAHNWLKDVKRGVLKEVRGYVEAEIQCYNKDKLIGESYAFATLGKAKTALANIDIEEVLKETKNGQNVLFGTLRTKIQKIVDERKKEGKKTKTYDLNDYFGLKIARHYSKNVLSDGTNLFSTEDLPTKTRPFWAPAFTIEAQQDKDWGAPLFKNDSYGLVNTDRLWYPKEFKFVKMTPMHLKILGTFPLNFKFNGPVKGTLSPEQRVNKERDLARYAVGDSVPPLVTLRLGLLINEPRKPLSNQVLLHAMYGFTPLSDFMHDLLDGFSEFLNSYKTSQNKDLAKSTKQLYKKTVKDWFATHEFLSKDGMIVDFPREGRPKTDNPEKIPAQGGSKESAVNRLWIAYLDAEVAKPEDLSKLGDRALRKYIIEKDLWTKKWTLQFHTDKQMTAYTRKRIEKENEKNISSYNPKRQTREKINKGDELTRKILTNAFKIATIVRKQKAKEQEEQRGQKRKSNGAGPSGTQKRPALKDRVTTSRSAIDLLSDSESDSDVSMEKEKKPPLADPNKVVVEGGDGYPKADSGGSDSDSSEFISEFSSDSESSSDSDVEMGESNENSNENTIDLTLYFRVKQLRF